MIPRLYPADETAFTTLGIGALADAESCIVSETLNGDEYYLDLVYPANGTHADDLTTGRIIRAIAHEGDQNPQPFDIVSVIRTMDGRVAVHAEHVTRRMAFMVCYGDTEVVNNSPQAAINRIKEMTIGFLPDSYPFDINANFVVSGSRVFRIENTTNVWERLMGADESVLFLFGGEWIFDQFTATLVQSRGADRGVRISYGKNLTDITQEQNLLNTYTSVVPTCSTSNGLVISSTEYIDGPFASEYPFRRFLAVDLADIIKPEPGTTPTDSQLDYAAELYIRANLISVPKVAIDVSFAPLWQMSGYEFLRDLEHVELGDTVTVQFPALGVDTKAKVTRTVYDVLRDRYDQISVGEGRQTLAETLYEVARGRIVV